MAKIYDLAIATSKYIDRNGNEKSNWENVGAVFEKENGGKFMTLKATFNPAGIERKAGSDSIIISMFPPKDRNVQQEQHNSTVSQAASAPTGQRSEDEFFGAAINDMPF